MHIFRSRFVKMLPLFALGVTASLSLATPALAVIENTAKVSGSSPGSSTAVTATATESFDVADPIYNLVLQPLTVSPGSAVTTGNTIVWTGVFKNTGNVPLYDISAVVSSDSLNAANGVVAYSSITDIGPTGDSLKGDPSTLTVDVLGPGDLVTYTLTLPVIQTDVDNDTDRKLVATFDAKYATSAGGSMDSVGEATEAAELVARDPVLAMTKTGYINYGEPNEAVVDGSTDNLPAGTKVTYVYEILNDGNVTISGLTIEDDHLGDGPFTGPGIDGATLINGNGNASDSVDVSATDGEWSSLAPGDKLTVSTTYDVVVSDIANHQ